jgi:hypothetical protein
MDMGGAYSIGLTFPEKLGCPRKKKISHFKRELL